MKKRPNGLHIATYLILILATAVSLFPFWFMFVSATNTNAEILSATPKLFFGSHLMQNFSNLKERLELGRVLFNSIVMTVSYTLLSIIIHSMSGYAFAKYTFKGKGFLFGLIMLTMMFPGQVLYVPLFTLINRIGWGNTYQAVVLPGLAGAFGLFLMRQNMLAFPTTLIEAARIDGYGEFGIFMKVVMPSMKPALGALTIYMFMSMWNNFMWPLIITSTESMYNFPVALAMLDGVAWKKDFGVIMLATVCAVLPVLIIFLVFQKQFVAGVMGGAVKE